MNRLRSPRKRRRRKKRSQTRRRRRRNNGGAITEEKKGGGVGRGEGTEISELTTNVVKFLSSI